MKRRTLKHPRKVMWAMRDFINEIHDLTYTALYWNFEEKKLESKEEKAVCKMVHCKDNFSACLSDKGYHEFRIGYDIEHLMNDKTGFRKNFESRCPAARGFADVTLALLHELGHFSTEQDFEGTDYNRDAAMFTIFLLADSETEANEMYFQLPDERNATDWAIEWLANAENRKTAKRFEKKFFACFE